MKNYSHIYFILVNLVTFFLYGIDKRRARKKKRRIKEALLLGLGLIGGGAGGFLGMKFFKHKTKKTYFYLVNFFGIFILIKFLLYKFG
jgi:uncharacterized membrane protein YsdA (DUF1294 family)